MITLDEEGSKEERDRRERQAALALEEAAHRSHRLESADAVVKAAEKFFAFLSEKAP